MITNEVRLINEGNLSINTVKHSYFAYDLCAHVNRTLLSVDGKLSSIAENQSINQSNNSRRMILCNHNRVSCILDKYFISTCDNRASECRDAQIVRRVSRGSLHIVVESGNLPESEWRSTDVTSRSSDARMSAKYQFA